MSGRTPFFLTGANARILLNNKSVAFATDVSFKITVKHASPRVLGRYEVEVIEPLSYDVMGSFTVIRYARGLKNYLGGNTPNDAANKGNGIGSFGLAAFGGPVGSAIGLPTSDGQWDGKADEAFDPSRFFQSKMFDIEIRQKVPVILDTGTGANGIMGITKSFFKGLDDALVKNVTNPTNTETTVVLLRDCRIEEADFRLSKRGVATQTFTFKARYADEDTQLARKSGVGQELS
jgi:hypothetical protein